MSAVDPIIPVHYQIFYIVIGTISIIGNGFIVYVTIRSSSLRSPCNIFIALISVGDLVHMFAHYIMVISHNVTHDHQLRHDVCLYWQTIPLFGMLFSSMMLLQVAVDRLLSLRAMYKVVCIIVAPMVGATYQLFLNATMIINLMIISCYAVFLCLVRRVHINQDNMRHIYRSLIVISLSIVFGWLATMLIAIAGSLFHWNIERLHLNFIAGLFLNFSCACNFFVYYAISNEYRRIFDCYLHIGRLKNAIGIEHMKPMMSAVNLYPDVIPVPYQVFYIIIPTISIIGNIFIVYVTIRSRSLRSPCNIFIALISMGDILHMLGHYVMIISHDVVDDHQLRQDICVYWQILPLIGLFYSSLMLLQVAIDRLLTLRSLYKFATGSYKSVYIAFQALISAVFATTMVVWIVLERDPKKKVVCVITAPMIGAAYQFFLNSIMVINILIIISYAVFLCFVRRVRINQDNMRHIYRSLIIISLSTVFGWFSTILIAFVGNVLHLQIDRIYVNLLAGLFVNCACACNFFVYYTVSAEYRRIFDYHLGIGRFKKAIGFKVASVSTEMPPYVTQHHPTGNPSHRSS
ncbi:hypothetical protein Q1695_007775 [Nippostrongylus brasiliensis]|nr:hypothetical protein Q1695_007775 [Nippostrongylus brasiliensis]